MHELEKFGLAQNPFPLVPGANVTNWAGMDEIREKLEDIVHSVLTTDTGLSEFVIVFGSYGAGKTHALKYLTTLINDTQQVEYRARAIYMPKVRVSQRVSFRDLYFHIVQQLGADYFRVLAAEVQKRISDAADSLADPFGFKEAKAFTDVDPQYFEKQVLSTLPSEDQPMVRLLLDLARGHEQQVLRFLFEGKPTVQGSAFSQEISSDFVAAQVLSAIFRTMTLPIAGTEPIQRGVHLFIDEVEEALEAKATDVMDLWFALRELINRLPYNFALLLAFTAEAALLEAVMPLAIVERTSRQTLELPSLTIDQAKQFISNQLASFRVPGFVAPQPYYPFTEDAVEYVLEQTVLLVPRKIFRALRTVLERALRRENLQPGEEIDSQMAEEIILATGL